MNTWQYKKVGDVFESYSGGTPLKTNKEFYEGGNIPWLMSGEVCKKYITEAKLSITQKGLENSSAKYYPENTVLIAMYGATAAQVGILKFKATSNQAVCGLLPNKDFLPEFVYNWFLYKQSYLASQAQGGAQPNISQAKIKGIEIPILPLTEQDRIVKKLDEAFAKIDALKQNAEKGLQAVKDLWQATLKEELKPKKGWERCKLKDVCIKITDGTHNSPINTSEGDYMYVTAKNIKRNGLDLSNITYVKKDVHNEIFSRCNPQKGDVLYIKDGATTGIAIINPLEEEFSLLSSVALIKTKAENLLNSYLCHYLNSPIVYEFVRGKMEGAAITRITIQKIKDFDISIPPLKEQEQISLILDTVRNKCLELQNNYEQELSEYDALKQSILRKSFSGEL